MPVNYKLYQEKRQGSKHEGKWYARTVMTDRADLRKMARKIERNVSVKESDVYAVLIELVNVMKEELMASHSVVIERLGTFRVGISTSPAETAADFSVSTNVKHAYVNFQAEQRYLSGRSLGKKGTNMLLNGLKMQELPANDVAKK